MTAKFQPHRMTAMSGTSIRCWRRALRCNRAASAVRKPRKQHAYSTGPVSRDRRPFRMAIVGSGPAGFYTAYRVMSRLERAKVDMYEALPVPFGLVRFGVAPDHPGVKNCQAKFDDVARSPAFTFLGNVSVGHPSGHRDGVSVPLAALLRHYDAVCFAYGASGDRALGVPGEDALRGVYSARRFVGWYNGLPGDAGLAPDLTRGDEAIVIGQGNVALDVARMLLEDVATLRRTDMAEHALEAFSRSRIKRVHVVGRRGPMQAAFAVKEARELMRLRDVAFHPVEPSLIPGDLKSLPRAPRRLMEVLVKGSALSVDRCAKSWSLDFCLSPRAFHPDATSPSRVGYIELERTSLSAPFAPSAHATGTGQTVQLSSSAVFRSIGYQSVALPGFAQLGIPFDDDRGVIRHDGQGRVAHETRTPGAAAVAVAAVPGLYCAGWVKRGPTGVIASTMQDAFVTADAIVQDWASQAPFLPGTARAADADAEAAGWEGVRSELPSAAAAAVVGWDDWLKIDRAEKARGQKAGKEREKFVTTEDMLQVVA